ncbi:MAG: hypothetical protein ACJAUP_002856 [Cellvibrionaceae bacterium]
MPEKLNFSRNDFCEMPPCNETGIKFMKKFGAENKILKPVNMKNMRKVWKH